MDDLISRDFIKSLGGECIAARDSKTHELLPISSIDALPPAQPDLIAKIQNGINATNADDVYSCGMRNGMRWCKSLLDDEEPKYEDASRFAQPEITRCKDCKNIWYSGTATIKGVPTKIHKCGWWNNRVVSEKGFCYMAERKTDD